MKIASLYIDLDNMLGYCYALNLKFRPDLIKRFILNNHYMKIIKARAYGNLDAALPHFAGFYLSKEDILSELEKNDIEFFPLSGKKNYADLALSLDAMLEANDYDITYLVSSDTDFVPLFNKLLDMDKMIFWIRMFKPENSLKDLDYRVKIKYYRQILSLDSPDADIPCYTDMDYNIIKYRNFLEKCLGMDLPTKSRVSEICNLAKGKFYSGMSLTELADLVDDKDAFKILRTALYGGGFRYKALSLLLEIKPNISENFYFQCENLVKRRYKFICADAFRRTFIEGRY